MADLATDYMGLKLAHPVVASASPLSRTLDGIRRLEDAGAAAIVLFSLFEEQIRRENEAFDNLTDMGAESFGELLGYFPEIAHPEVGPEPYLDLVRRASAATAIPIIASLNGVTSEGWTDYAARIEEAGAAGIELNVYHIAADMDVTAAEVERRYLDALQAVKRTVRIPVAMKLGPYFSAFGHLARELVEAGADALVLFNRFYQPDFDLDALEVRPDLALSQAYEMRLPLMWIALLGGRIDASLAATTGVQGPEEIVKYLLAGADIVMTTSSLLHHGPGHLKVLKAGLNQWLDDHGYSSVGQLRGAMSQRNAKDPGAFERANYLRVLDSVRSASDLR